MSGTARRVARNSAVVFVARAADVLTGVITIPLLTRYLGAELYGSYAWILALIFPFQTLVNFEMNTILTREIARKPEGAAEQLGAALWIKWCLTVVFAVAMLGAAAFGDLPRVVAVALAVAVVGEIALQHGLLWGGVFNAHQRMEIETLLNLIMRAITLGGMIAVVAADLGFVALFVVIAAAYLVRAVLGGAILLRGFVVPRLRPRFTEIRRLIREAGLMTLASTLMAFGMRTSVYLLEHLRNAEQVGFYNVAFSLVLTLQILPTALVTALFPVFSSWGEEGGRDKIVRAAGISSAVMVLAGGGLAALVTPVSGWVILILSGPQFLPAGRSLQVLLWCAPVLFLNYLLSFLLISLELQRKLITGATVTIVLTATLGWLLIPGSGHVGAAIATFIGLAAQTGIIMYYLKRALPSLDYRASMGRPAWICALALAGALGGAKLGGMVAPLVAPLAGLLLAGVVLVGGLRWCKLFPAEEWRVVQEAFRSRRQRREDV